MNAYNTYDKAVEKIAKYDKEMFLGRLVWYAISEDLRVTCNDFIKRVTEEFENVFDSPVLQNEAKAPLQPKLSNVFKRACTDSTRKNLPGDQPETFYNYLIRPSGSDSGHIWQTIVRETVDREGHTLSYAELVRITFFRAEEKIRFNNISDEDNEELDEDPNVNSIVEHINEYYRLNKDVLTPYTIREWLRGFLERTLKSTRVRPSGGVYFVSEDFGDALDALDRLFNSFGPEASFHYLPLLNDAKQKEMLRAAYESESVDAVDEMIGSLAEVLGSDKKISSSAFANYKVEYDRLRAKTKDYSDLLEDSLFGTSNRLDIMHSMLIKLMSKVKV